MSTATSNTLEHLARLASGRFQRIGDELLPLVDVRLHGIRANGVNQDDRTVTGVPDSFVGPSPADCVVAVEYTTQRSGIASKFARDLAEVAHRCPRAGLVVLVSASSIEGMDLTEVRNAARDHGRESLTIGGDQLARLLDNERQDLRRDYLNIPIATHSIESVRRVFASHSRTALADGHVRREDLECPIQRDRLTREVAVRTAQLGGKTYVHAPIGTGKSTWSCAFALGRGETTPAVWIAATDVAWEAGIDPLGAHLTHIAHGAPSPERTLDLAELLGRFGMGLVAVIDGIDEVEDYTVLARALKQFSTGAIGSRTHLIATFRTNALLALGDALPGRGRDQRAAIIAMPIPDERDLTTWLVRCGIPGGRAREAASLLPSDLRRPLFLRLAVGLPRDALTSEAALASRVVDHYCSELARSLRVHGAGPSTTEIRESIGALAWACMGEPADAVERSAASASRDLWRADGERSLLGRCVASGLLRVRSGGRLAFTHAFFQEAFAAAVAPNGAAPWGERVNALRPQSRHARLGALVDRLPAPEPLLEPNDRRRPAGTLPMRRPRRATVRRTAACGAPRGRSG